MKSIVVITLLSIAACKGKGEPAAAGSGSSGSAGSGSAKSGFGSGAAPEQPASGSAKGSGSAAPSNELPKACDEWKAMVDKLMACDKMPEPQRKIMKDAYDQASALWPAMPAASKAELAISCKAAADTIMSSAKATCGW